MANGALDFSAGSVPVDTKALDFSASSVPVSKVSAGAMAGRQFVAGGGDLLNALDSIGSMMDPGRAIGDAMLKQQLATTPAGAGHAQDLQDTLHPLGAYARAAHDFGDLSDGEMADGLGARVAGNVGRVIPSLAGAIATGGESSLAGALPAAVRSVPVLGRLATAVAGGAPTAASLTGIQASNLPDAMPAGAKAKQVAQDLGINLAMAGLPAAIGKSLLARIASGAGIGYGSSAGISALQGQPQDQAANLAGALMGGVLGQHSAAHTPDVTDPHLDAYMRSTPHEGHGPDLSADSVPVTPLALPAGADFSSDARVIKPSGGPVPSPGPIHVDPTGQAFTPEQGRSELGAAMEAALNQPARPALPGPVVSVDKAGTAMSSADFLAKAKAAQAAAEAQGAASQQRTDLGITPDIERTQRGRWEAQHAAALDLQARLDAQGSAQDELAQQGTDDTPPWWMGARGGELDHEATSMPRTAATTSAAAEAAASSPVTPRAAAPVDTSTRPPLDHMRSEIGWDQVGGRVLRAAGEGPLSESDGALPHAGEGDVVGRTTWVGKAGPEGESSFWRLRPETGGKISEKQAHAALDKYAAGEPLNTREQRFIDYAHKVSDDYDARHAEQTAEFERDQADMDAASHAQALAELRSHQADFHGRDAHEALTLAQWVQRAHDAGVAPEHIIDATWEGTDAERTAKLSRAITNQESRHAVVTRAEPVGGESHARADQGRQAAAGAEPPGFALANPEARTEAAPRPVASQTGLFAPATTAEHVRAASVAKDESRNGLTGGKNDTRDGGLFDGKRPEQVDVHDASDAAWLSRAKAAKVNSESDLAHFLLAKRHPETERAFHSRFGQDEVARNVAHRIWGSQARVPDSLDSTDATRQASIDQGNADADRLGIRAAVTKALGPVADRVEYLHGYAGLPENMRKGVESRNALGRKGVTAAMYSPDTGRVFLFTDIVKTADRAVWHAAHEIAGHAGLRALLGDRLDPALNIALQNPTVKALADEIFQQRKIGEQMKQSGKSHADGLLLSAEEALAELGAAIRTGDFEQIKSRYGVDVPPGIREKVKAAIANFLKRLKAMIDDLFGKHTFSDADVRDLMESAWQAAKESPAASKPREAAMDRMAAEPREVDSTEDQTDTPAFKRWFGESKVVDAQGKPQRMYHGSQRPDRIGDRFRASRATSGPMAFFTNNPSVASGYATGKSDTSLDAPDDYAAWFKYKPPGSRSEVDITRAWHHLTREQQAVVAERIPHVTTLDENDESGPIRLGDADTYGDWSKGHWEHELKQARGNVLQAAKSVWLDSGNLFGNEGDFLDVLKLGGMPMDRTRLDDPNATYSAVLPVYLKIADPFDTANAKDLLPTLEKAGARQRKASEYGADIWDKRSRSAQDWLQSLRDDIESGSTHAWTSIPDWVTKTLKEWGYDGIKDSGGKNGGVGHDVWIPFTDTQVKSATGNNGNFDPAKPSILESLDPGEEQFSHLQDMPSRRPGESQSDYTRRVMRKNGDEIKQALQLAKRQRDIGRLGMRAMWATQDRTLAKADAAFAQYRKLFDKEDQAVNLRTIDQWETGRPIADYDARQFFDTMKEAFDQRTAKIQALAPDAMQQLIDHYFPHIWEDSSRALKWYQGLSAKRPLQGDRSFLKQRVHATIKDGMASGLKPVSTNPVDLAILKLGQMDKFIAFHEFRADLQKRGWLRKMDAGERVPVGYARVDDPAFQIAGGLQGYHAVPELIARDINNYLSPSLYRFGAWKALRTVQNVLMSSRLGLSMFHGGFTTMDNLVMHADVAGRRMMAGDLAGGLGTLLKAPLSIVWSPIEGGKLNKEWLGLTPSDQHTAAILDMLEQGGAHMKMSATDYNNALPKLIKAVRQKSATGTLKQTLPALGEAISWIIHHKLVPNQKMAARVMLAKFELDRVAGTLGKKRGDYAGIINALHPDALKQIAAHVVDLVDDRLGQMNYDNQFWNKTAREASQAAIGAVGWQVGTLRTVTGGVRDLVHLWKPEKLLSTLDKAGNLDGDLGRVSGRLTYLVTLALLMGGLSAVTQYLLTGKGPEEIKDYFYPKTGNTNDDGSDERLQWPSYWSDHYKLATHPLQTATHKINPSIGMLMEALSNQDYFGTEIRNEDDSWWKQAGQVGAYLAKGFIPYSITGAQKNSDTGVSAGRQVANFFGITKAPASVSRSKFQAFVADKAYDAMPQGSRSQAQAQHSQAMHAAESAIRRGQTPDMEGLTDADRRNVDKAARQETPAIRFRRLGIEDKLRAYDLATPAERERYQLAPMILRSNWHKAIRDLPDAERDDVLEKIQALTP